MDTTTWNELLRSLANLGGIGVLLFIIMRWLLTCLIPGIQNQHAQDREAFTKAIEAFTTSSKNISDSCLRNQERICERLVDITEMTREIHTKVTIGGNRG